MAVNVPRILLAAPSSGSGKTTAMCAVMEVLRRKGLDVRSFKCGPDYIDPMFHRAVLGADGGNLDPFFCDGNLMRSLIGESAGGDISVIEGVMGYYDGTGTDGTDNSTYTVASKTRTPVILVINGKGAAVSLLAVIEGFIRYTPDSRIKGVLFNRVSPMTYINLVNLMHRRFGDSVIPVGYIPVLPEGMEFGSRHLGLITAPEIADLREKLTAIGDVCEKTIDTDALLAIARDAEPLEYKEADIPKLSHFTLAVARDDAFCFYYRDTLRLFERMGAELKFFSPLKNEEVPKDADGLLLGGGYPELYADALESNITSRESVKRAVNGGMPVIAECGGFQYLGSKLDGKTMCGVLPHESVNTGKLVRFGYVILTANTPGLLGDANCSFKAHEFHYYDSTENGSSFSAVKPNGRAWECAVMNERMYAGYPHLYLRSCPQAAVNFCKKCIEYKSERTSK